MVAEVTEAISVIRLGVDLVRTFVIVFSEHILMVLMNLMIPMIRLGVYLMITFPLFSSFHDTMPFWGYTLQSAIRRHFHFHPYLPKPLETPIPPISADRSLKKRRLI